MIKNSRQAIWLPLFLALSVILGVFIGSNLNLQSNKSGSNSVFRIRHQGNDKISKLLNLIDEEYVDTVNSEQLTDKAMNAILQNLDPHSSYIPPVDLKAVNEDLEGNFEGVGIEFNIVNDSITVVAVIPEGPSDKIGIRPGDRIVLIEGKKVAGIKISNEEVIKTLRGEKGSLVKVSIARKGSKILIDYTIKRGKIPIHSVDASYMINSEIGYIKISRFAGNTFDEYLEAEEKLRKSGMKKMVLDLRGNPGGYLDQATDLADDFLKDQQLIVYTEGKNRKKQFHNATVKGNFESGPLAILIDESSASASEIVAGAIQDHDRGVIVGKRSFGKGLVQEQMDFPDGSAVRLTVARYYTPSGRCIQRTYKDGTENYYRDAAERMLGEANDSLSDKGDTVKYFTDKKRVVYGGGGIAPDISVKLDTTFYSSYFASVSHAGIIYDFGFDYTDKYRRIIQGKYPNYLTFAKDKSIDSQLLSEFIRYAEAKGIPRKEADIKKSQKEIIIRLKANVARNMWRNEAYYYIISETDETLNAALKELNK